jgi:hypothetical protein
VTLLLGGSAPGARGDAKSVRSATTRRPPALSQIAKLVASGAKHEHIDEVLDREEARTAVLAAFNTNPIANYPRLCEFYHRPPTPDTLTRIFRKLAGLDSEKITEFLLHPGHEQFAQHFFKSYDMRTDFLTAFRRCFCGPYYLPKESKFMERAMRYFAEAYTAVNPRSFADPKDAVMLGYTIYMANVQLGQPDTMTRDSFVSSAKTSLRGTKMPTDKLVNIYNALVEMPLALEPKSVTFLEDATPKMKGWLKKRTPGLFGQATVNYFVLVGSALYWFKDNSFESKGNPQGKIELQNVIFAEDPKKPLKFTISSTKDALQYTKYGLGGVPEQVSGVKSLEFEAKVPELRANWLVRLRRVADRSGGGGKRGKDEGSGDESDGFGDATAPDF